MGIFGFFNKNKKETLDRGLEKTKTSVFDKLARAVAGKSKVDDDVLDNLEEVLITSDVGVDTTLKIIQRIEERVARDKYVSTSELNSILRQEIAALLSENNTEDNDNWELPTDHKPYVILVVGVNGVGKTTTIGKLAYQFKNAGKKVFLGAADTFRAAAVDQLCIWGERVGSSFSPCGIITGLEKFSRKIISTRAYKSRLCNRNISSRYKYACEINCHKFYKQKDRYRTQNAYGK